MLSVPKPAGGQIVFAFGVLALSVGVAAVVVAGSSVAPRATVSLSLAFVVACAAPFVVGWRRGLDLCAPIYLVAAWYLVAFPLRMLFIDVWPLHATFLGTYWYRDYLERALLLSLLGFVALLVGYYLPAARRVASSLPRPSLSFAAHPLNARLTSLLFVGAAAWAYLLFVVHRVHGLDDSFNNSVAESFVVQCGYFLSYTAALVAIIVFGRAPRLRARELLIVTLSVAPSLAVAALFAQRFILLLAIGAVVIGYHYSRRPIGLRQAALALVIIVGFVFPVIAADRAVGVSQFRGAGVGADLHRVESATSAVFGSGTGMRTYIVDGFMNRMSGIDTLAGVMKATPSRVPYLPRLDYLTTPVTAVVPRAVWGSKPRDQFSQEFAPIYFGSSNFQTHVVTYNQPDLYLHFGVWGVIIGSFIFGLIYRLIYEYLVGDGRPKQPGAVFLYVFLLLYVGAVEWSVPEIEVAIAKGMPFMVLILWWLRTPGRAAYES